MKLSAKQINILHLLSGFSVGGAEKLLLNLCNCARSDENIKHHFAIIKNIVDENYKKELLSLGITLTIINNNSDYRDLKNLFKLLKITKDNNIDIIHSHDENTKFWSIMCKPFNSNLKLINTIHNNNLISCRYNPIHRFIHRTFIDSTVTVSNYSLNEAKIFSIPNAHNLGVGIDLALFSKNQAKLNSEQISLNIVNISRINLPKKGQDILIKALKECKNRGINFTCNFIGGVYDYDTEAMKMLNELVKKNNLEKEINFLGMVSDSEKLKIMSESNLFVLPSRTEGLPAVILEAMATGLPVISSNINGSNELIEHEKTGLLFENENHHDLANKICDLYHNREKLYLIAQNGFKFVQKFDIHLMTQNYHKLYKRLTINKTINVLDVRYGFNRGGVENFILNTVRNTNVESIENNIKHNLLIFKDKLDESLIDELKAEGCNVFKIKTKDSNNILTLFKILKILKKNNIDVVHCHDPGGIKWMIICKFFIPKLKLIFRINDTNIVSRFNKLEIFTIKHFTDKVIAVSNAVQAEIIGTSINNAEVIYNGVDIKKFAQNKKLYDLNNDCLKIINLAWLRLPKKGQDVLIKALSICKIRGLKFSCDLIGGVYDEKSFQLLKDLIKENNLEKEVHFLGHKKNVHKILSNYDLFVFPSRFEGRPNVILEAMSAGLPVISSNIGGSNELIEHEKTGLLFENEKHEELADKICDLYYNKEKMLLLAKNGFEFVQNFNINQMKRNYYDLYKKLSN